MTLEPNSKYFLAVQSSYEGTAYQLCVEAVTDDYPNEWTEAVEIKAGSSIDGVISNKGDSDWLKFTPFKTAKYAFKRTGSGVRFEIYNQTATDRHRVVRIILI